MGEMRTEDDLVKLLNSLGMTEANFQRRLFFSTSLWRYGNHRRMLNQGLITGYGDSFAYKGQGVIVVGESGMGKSSLTGRFAEQKNATKLSEDEFLIFGDGQLRVYAYPDLEMGVTTWKETLRTYAAYLTEGESYPLRAILHLRCFEGFTGEGVEPDMENMLEFISIPDVKSLSHPSLEGVTFLEYMKCPKGQHNYNQLEVFREIRSKLNEII